MTYGSNQAVADAEEAWRGQCAQLIARYAAELVAARDVSRKEAIAIAVMWLRNEQAADADPTGTVAVENVFPFASKASPSPQVAAIAAELLDAAREAVDSSGGFDFHV